VGGAGAAGALAARAAVGRADIFLVLRLNRPVEFL
jgi:hypothetical protein